MSLEMNNSYAPYIGSKKAYLKRKKYLNRKIKYFNKKRKKYRANSFGRLYFQQMIYKRKSELGALRIIWKFNKFK